jgi:hypothetical protein
MSSEEDCDDERDSEKEVTSSSAIAVQKIPSVSLEISGGDSDGDPRDTAPFLNATDDDDDDDDDQYGYGGLSRKRQSSGVFHYGGFSYISKSTTTTTTKFFVSLGYQTGHYCRRFGLCISTCLGLLTLLFLVPKGYRMMFSISFDNNNNGSHTDVCYDIFSIPIDDLLHNISNSYGSDLCVYRYKDKHGCQCRTNGIAYYPDNYDNYMSRLWDTTTNRNVALISREPQISEYDVVFYGDSITEHWMGTDLSKSHDKWAKIHQVFDDAFNKRNGKGSLDGIALGIGGDRVRFSVCV